MQASIDILKQIVLTDNDIFQETKALLDYKEFEKSQIAEQASDYDQRIDRYIQTISKLQHEHERLTKEVRILQQTNQFYVSLIVLAALFIIGVFIFLFRKRQKLTKA